MNNRAIISMILLTSTVLIGCVGRVPPEHWLLELDNINNIRSNPMKNLVSIIEIPVTDLQRAVTFYQNILDISMEQAEMDGVHMGIFPGSNGVLNMVLAEGHDYKTTAEGVLIYLDAGEDLRPVLHKIPANGGKVVVERTKITEDMGYFAVFIDTEGNKIGVHSRK